RGTGDPLTVTVSHRDYPVEGARDLRHNVGTRRHTMPDVGRELGTNVLLLDADFDVDARRFQEFNSLTRNSRIGIDGANDDFRNTRFDNGLGARPGSPDVTTGLEGHDHRGAASGVAGTTKRFDLGVRLTGCLGVTVAHDDATVVH